MQFDWWTFALQTINFIVLVWLLNRFFYKPVLRAIDARRQQIDKQFTDAKTADDKAGAKLKEIEDDRAKIAAEREQITKSAAQQADQAARARMVQAESQAQALMDDTRKALAREREQTKAELHEFALGLASDMARKLVSELPPDKRSEAWLERIESYFANLSAKERNALVAQTKNGGAVDVITAGSLPAESADEWRARLGKVLGAKTNFTFDVDPRLIAGVELHFSEAILRFSLQDAIARLHDKVETSGKAAQ
ncbi:MAG: hypothetical protein GC190_04365 [Alphaproteobacteria bacterium]|nr:hypothetical protein [Alphaproteobacteria bacterium]